MHEADIALLNQVGQFDAVVSIFMGDLDDKAQIRDHQLFRRRHIIVLLELDRQFELLFRGQEGIAVDLGDVDVQRAGYGG